MSACVKGSLPCRTHLAIVSEGPKLRLYLNGALDAQRSFSHASVLVLCGSAIYSRTEDDVDDSPASKPSWVVFRPRRGTRRRR